MAAMGRLLSIGSAVIAGADSKVPDSARSVIGPRVRSELLPGADEPTLVGDDDELGPVAGVELVITWLTGSWRSPG